MSLAPKKFWTVSDIFPIVLPVFFCSSRVLINPVLIVPMLTGILPGVHQGGKHPPAKAVQVWVCGISQYAANMAVYSGLFSK